MKTYSLTFCKHPDSWIYWMKRMERVKCRSTGIGDISGSRPRRRRQRRRRRRQHCGFYVNVNIDSSRLQTKVIRDPTSWTAWLHSWNVSSRSRGEISIWMHLIVPSTQNKDLFLSTTMNRIICLPPSTEVTRVAKNCDWFLRRGLCVITKICSMEFTTNI